MKTLSSLVAASLSAAVLAACGGPGALASRSAPLSELPSQSKIATVSQRKPSASPLYVLNSSGSPTYSVSIYAAGALSPLRNIAVGSYSGGFTVDPLGRLYVGVSSSPSGPGLLDIYANRGAKLVRTLHQTKPFGLLTVDWSGDLYTMCAPSRVCEYASAKQRVIRRIALGKFGASAYALAVDGAGNLAVDSLDSILIFAPGAAKPYWKITRANAASIAFDTSGDLFVADTGSCCGTSSIAVYAPGGTSPIRTITDGNGQYPAAMSFDENGNLYVATYCLNSCGIPPAITEYAPDGTTPIRTVTEGLVGIVLAMTLDSSGNLYVANGGNRAHSDPNPGNLVVYAPGTTLPMRTVTNGIQNPIALGIGP